MGSTPRKGFHSLTPRIVVADPEAQIAFLRAVFDATGDYHPGRPAEIRIGDSLVMVTSAAARDAFPGFLYVYVDHADAVYRRALEAGAASIEAPFDTPYGDRRAMVRDPFGNVWQIAHVLVANGATRIEVETMRAETTYIHNGKGTVRAYVYGRLDLLDFVKNVFDAVELERNKFPSGFHVQAQIGDSVLVLSAMDPPYSAATKASVYVYVADVDATYQRALSAGAVSITAPKDQPWKGRNAGVKDSFGNIWYIETYKG